MPKRKWLYMNGILLLIVCMLAGCASGGQGKLEEKEKVDYSIGVVEENAPYYYEEDGTPKGYYVDFISKLSKKKAFTYEFVPVDTSTCEELLSDKKINAFIGDSITETGQQDTFDESKSFYTSEICILSAPGSSIRSLKEIKGKNIAAVSGAEEEAAAKYLANKYEGQSVAFSSVKEALTDIKEGYSQILVVDEEYYKNQEETFKNWIFLKKLENFQNKHKFFAMNNNSVYEAK